MKFGPNHQSASGSGTGMAIATIQGSSDYILSDAQMKKEIGTSSITTVGTEQYLELEVPLEGFEYGKHVHDTTKTSADEFDMDRSGSTNVSVEQLEEDIFELYSVIQNEREQKTGLLEKLDGCLQSIEQLMAENETLRAECEESQSGLGRALQDLSNSTAELHEMKQSWSSTEDDVQQIQQELRRLSEELERKSEELQESGRARQEQEQEQRALSIKLQETEQQLEESANQLVTLRLRLESKTQYIEEMEHAKEMASEQLEATKAELEQKIQEKDTDHREVCLKMRARALDLVNQKEQEIERMKEMNDHFVNEYKKGQERARTLEREIASLELVLESREETLTPESDALEHTAVEMIGPLYQQIDNLQLELTKKEDLMSEHSKEMERLEGDFSDFRRHTFEDKKDLSDELSKAQHETVSLRRGFAAERERANNEKAKLSKTISKRDERIKELEQNIPKSEGVIICVDASGSMFPNSIYTARETLRKIVFGIACRNPSTRIGIIAHSCRGVHKRQPMKKVDSSMQTVLDYEPSGNSEAYYGAFTLANTMLSEFHQIHPSAKSRIILIGDGGAEKGDINRDNYAILNRIPGNTVAVHAISTSSTQGSFYGVPTISGGKVFYSSDPSTYDAVEIVGKSRRPH